VAFVTPVFHYGLKEGVALAAVHERSKRTRKRSESIHNSFEPLRDMHEWEEYTGEYNSSVLLVEAAPQLRETFFSAWVRGVAASEGMYGGPARMKFKTDFYRMKLFCGAKEIEPIQPGKAANVVNAHNAFVNVTDATYVGVYSYPPDAISPSCGRVTLQIFSEKDPGKSESRDLDQKSIDRVWNDFRPYLAARGSANNSE
jgi:hypothetical protein